MLLGRKIKNTVPAPFEFRPSNSWLGNDGNWSTFTIQIGNPPQDFDVLPSTAGQAVIVPMPEGCTSDDPSDCETLRGSTDGLGLNTSSSSFQYLGVYTSPLEQRLGYSVNAEYGFDTVALENAGNTDVLSQSSALVAGVAAKDFYLGLLGLGTQDASLTGGSVIPAYMKSLFNSSLIPSLSYGYTAGASYRSTGVAGSLVLGGYDRSRMEPGKVNFPFSNDDTRPLEVTIQSILGQNTLLGTHAMNSEDVVALIDSTVPELWLPRSICDQFAAAFGLDHDEDTGLYIYGTNNIHRYTLVTQNTPASIRISLGPYNNTAESEDITLPYAAFDLEVSAPTYPNATKFFPIRVAANQSQITLGRVFLQEAYLTVDWNRGNFSVAQAISTPPLPSKDIVAILPPSATPAPTKPTLSSGAIAGIVIGPVVVIILVLAFFFIRRRRHRNNATTTKAEEQPAVVDSEYPEDKKKGAPFLSPGELSGGEELDGTPRHEMSGISHMLPEADGSTAKWGTHGVQELDSPDDVVELPGSAVPYFELPGSKVGKEEPVEESRDEQISANAADIERAGDAETNAREGQEGPG